MWKNAQHIIAKSDLRLSSTRCPFFITFKVFIYFLCKLCDTWKMVDHKLTFGIWAKVQLVLAALVRVVLNLGGTNSKRMQRQYAVPSWIKALNIKKSREVLEKTQNKILLRCVSGYKIISTDATKHSSRRRAHKIVSLCRQTVGIQKTKGENDHLK